MQLRAIPQAQPSSELLALQRLVASKGAPEKPEESRELRATYSGPQPIQLSDDKKPAEKPVIDQKTDLAARLEAGSQNDKLTASEAYALLEEYNKLNGKDHVIEGVADINSYRGEKGKVVGYAGRGGIDVDGRSAVGRQGFKKSAAAVRAELEAQEQAKAKEENRQPKAIASKDVDAETTKRLQDEGRYYDPASQPDVAGYKLKDADGKATVVPDAAKLPYSSVPAADPILNLVPYGAVVFVKYGDRVSLTIRIDAGGQHVGEISRAAGEQVGIENLDPIHGGVSSKSLAYLAVPSVRIPNGTLSVADESPEGLEAAALPKVRMFLHTLSLEVGGAAKK